MRKIATLGWMAGVAALSGMAGIETAAADTALPMTPSATMVGENKSVVAVVAGARSLSAVEKADATGQAGIPRPQGAIIGIAEGERPGSGAQRTTTTMPARRAASRSAALSPRPGAVSIIRGRIR